MRFHDGSDKGRASHFLQFSEKLLQRPWQCFDDRSEKKEWALHGCLIEVRIRPGGPNCTAPKTWLSSLTQPIGLIWLFSVSSIEDKTESPAFWNKWSDRGRITGGAEHPLRTRILGCILKMTSAGRGTYAQKTTTWSAMVANRPKVSFRRDGSTSSGNYGRLFVCQRYHPMPCCCG
jgi:hypothetical protein